jgi:Ca2+-binding RTX toxin-like protein
MATTPELALLALRVYSTPLASDPDPLKRDNEKNRPAVPEGWIEREWHPDQGDGFSYGIYQNGTEIVISYAGTNENIDWASNAAVGLGLGSTQVTKAALAYVQAQQQYGSNITFTGHSLGGGLASVMAVWFDRPAVVFDEAPFEATALNPIVMAAMAASLTLSGYSVPKFTEFLNSYTLIYNARESQVTNHYLQGEALATLRAAFPTILGTGQDNVIHANITDMGGIGGSVDLHSQALLTAMLVSNDFRLATYASTRVIPLLMEKHLYAFSTQSPTDENVLIKFIRSEQSTGDILTHFANDLYKLGTTVAGLSVAAQNAIIAQGIEWYYWQKNDYAGQEFFTKTGNLLQYTTAQGAGLDGALNKANLYTGAWLATLNSAYGLAYMPIIKTDYQQWNINGGVNAVTATAKNIDKTQIFIGQAGSDTFTGGNKDDVFFAGDGADTLDGGKGNDSLYGGNGQDTYKFSENFGLDTVVDADGNGVIELDGNPLDGGNKIGKGIWQNAGKTVIYTFEPGADGKGILQITRKGEVGNTIRVLNWQNNQMGIVLDEAAAVPANGGKKFIGDQRAPISNGFYNWGATTRQADGTLTGGVAEADFADVLIGTSFDDKIEGLGGNDALIGGAGNDQIDGGYGDDLISGGTGHDVILGGAGNDYIFSAASASIFVSSHPGEVFRERNPQVPVDSPVISQAPTWAVYQVTENLHRVTSGIDANASNDGDVVDAGEGNDHVAGSHGADDIKGGDGEDELYGLGGGDVIAGDAGDDFIAGDGVITIGKFEYTAHVLHGADYLDGGAGDDVLWGQGGSDQLFGGSGNDELHGDGFDGDGSLYVPNQYNGNDYLDGEDGDDLLVGGGKDDVLYGGMNNDTLWGDDSTGLLAGAFNGNDYLDGEEGDDYLVGGGRDDTLYGGTGNDTLFGDSDASLGVAYHGIDYLDGEEGDDYLEGGGKDDTLYGGAGNDTLFGDSNNLGADYAGNDYLDGEDGDDILEGGGKDDTLYGGAGKDNLWGGDGNDLLNGEEDNDYLNGGAGNDVLFGDAGNDELVGKDGDDQLSGGLGDDLLFGGDGAVTAKDNNKTQIHIGCKHHRKHYKNNSCLGNGHAGYRHKWHSKEPSSVQNTHSVKATDI